MLKMFKRVGWAVPTNPRAGNTGGTAHYILVGTAHPTMRTAKIVREALARYSATELTYLVAAALFILALYWMNSPQTARRGVLVGRAGDDAGGPWGGP